MSVLTAIYKPFILIKTTSPIGDITLEDTSVYGYGEVVEIYLGCLSVIATDQILYDTTGAIGIATDTGDSYLLINENKIIAKPVYVV